MTDTLPLRRSISSSFHWSDSYPFRACASHASQRPSGEGLGEASSPALVGVRFRGAPPWTGIAHRSPFVLHASRCAGLAETITSAPSGVKAMSSPPPTRNVGQSESPGVTSRAGPPCAGCTHTRLRLLLPGPLRDDQELLCIRRPPRVLAAAAAGKLPRRAARERLEPDVLHVAVQLQRLLAHGECDLLAVRRGLRVVEAAGGEQLFGSERPAGESRGRAEEAEQDEAHWTAPSSTPLAPRTYRTVGLSRRGPLLPMTVEAASKRPKEEAR